MASAECRGLLLLRPDGGGAGGADGGAHVEAHEVGCEGSGYGNARMMASDGNMRTMVGDGGARVRAMVS